MKKPVVLAKCTKYELQDVKAALLKTIEALGGLSKYVGKKDTVLLKLNLLMRKKPEEATTTHPVFVQALAEILTEYGCDVLLGDSPGGPFTFSMLRSVYKATGIQDVTLKTKARLNFNVESCEKENPEGLILKKMTVTDMLNDVDKVISVSKLKTHGMMTFTGAVKNMFGVIPGIRKAEFHLNMPDYDVFADALVDICLLSNPVLSFMDGIEAMEGNGPSSGSVRKTDVILASSSPYHLDKAACTIAGIPLESVPTIKACIKREIVEKGLSDIIFLGDPIEAFKTPPFKLPDSKSILSRMNKIPTPIMGAVNNLLQPKVSVNHKECVGCGDCAKNCPARVIEMKNKKPHIDTKKCIRCYCCQELCPKGCVQIKRPAALRILTKS